MRKILEIYFFKEKLIYEIEWNSLWNWGGCVNISDIWAKGELKFTYLLEVSVVPYVTTYYPKITMGKTVSKSDKIFVQN